MYFLVFEGQELILPGRFYPDCGLLERHRGKMVVLFGKDKSVPGDEVFARTRQRFASGEVVDLVL